jgi:hypothetical protein
MTFQELQYHVEGLGCSLDPFEEDSFFVSNCINGHCCVIENLTNYAKPTLCHYFYELGISAPLELREEFNTYADLRRRLNNDLKVPIVEQSHRDE